MLEKEIIHSRILCIGIFCGVFFLIILPTLGLNSNGEIALKATSIDLIDLHGDNMLKEGSSTKIKYYKYVVLAFSKAMQLKGKKNGIDMQFLQPCNEILDFTEHTNSLTFEKKFKALSELTAKLILNYNDVILSGKSFCPRYNFLAYYYRLLIWLQVHITREHELDKYLKAIINHTISFGSAKYHYIPVNFMQKIKINSGLDHPSMRDIEKEVSRIYTLEELERYGETEDNIVEFCFELANTKGESAWDKKIEMRYEPTLYEDFLNEAYKYDAYSFSYAFKMDAEQILAYFYGAVCAKRGNGCQRIDGEAINLDSENFGKNIMKDARDVVILFHQASEKNLLPNKEENLWYFKDVLRLENFPVEDLPLPIKNSSDKFFLYSFKLNALFQLFQSILKNSKTEFITSARRDYYLYYSYLDCYRKMRRWLNVQFSKILRNGDTLFSDKLSINEDAKSMIYDDRVDDEYLKITTLKDLIDMCPDLSHNDETHSPLARGEED